MAGVRTRAGGGRTKAVPAPSANFWVPTLSLEALGSSTFSLSVLELAQLRPSPNTPTAAPH